MLPLMMIVAAYLLGSIPTGLLVARAFGITDPRGSGSGNIGAANLTRLGGKKIGLLTFAGDFLKGMVPVLSAQWYFSEFPQIAEVCAFAAVLGHCHSLFLLGSGGKGVATTAGAFISLATVPLGASIFIWAMCFYLFRTSSLAAIVAFVFFPFLLLFFPHSTLFLILAALTCAMVVRKHKDNLERLLSQQENSF